MIHLEEERIVVLGILFLLLGASFVPLIKGSADSLNTVDASSGVPTPSVQIANSSPDANQQITLPSASPSEKQDQRNLTPEVVSPEQKNQIKKNPHERVPVELDQNKTLDQTLTDPTDEKNIVLSSAINSPFRINNDTELINMAIANSWIGNGSVDNPYILDNISIDAGGAGYAIFIGNTTLHFHLQNATLKDTNFVSDPYDSGSAVILYNVSNAILQNNYITYYHSSPGLHNGMSIISCDNITIGHNAISNFHNYGIQLTSSTDIIIENNSINSGVYSSLRAIDLLSSSYNTIANNTLSNYYNGQQGRIYLTNSNNNSIVNNYISGTFNGIYIKSSNGNNISENTISCSNYKGLTLDQSNNTMIHQNSFSGSYGVYIISSNNDTVEFNTYNSVSYGIWILTSSIDIFLKNNTLNNCYFGIRSTSSSHLNISNNTMSGGYYAIYLESTGNCLIENNIISDTYDAGIYFYNSVNNIVLSNNLTRSSIGIYPTLADFTEQTIPTSNTVNGKPVYYYYDGVQDNESVPLDAGQVIVGNSSYLHIHNLNLSDQNYALIIGFSSDILIENNTFEHNSPYSVFSYDSDDNIYNNNTFNDSEYGLQLSFCDNNELLNNTITGDDYGAMLDQSDSVRLENNTITETTYYGIGLSYSSSCNFQNNTFLQSSIDISNGDQDTFSNQIIPTTNTVNSRPVYYYTNMNLDNASFPLDSGEAGEIILGNISYATVENQNLSDQNVGLLIGYSSNITVFNNTLASDSPYGIKMVEATDCQIDHNQITACEMGVYLDSSDRNVLIDNDVTECDEGFYFEYSNECNITDNQMTADNYCIDLYESTTNNISSNMLNDSDIGVYLYYNSDSNTVFDNTFDEINEEGIYVDYSDSNQLLGNFFNNTDYGIDLYDSADTVISNNIIDNCSQGITGDYADGTTVTKNSFSNNDFGTYIVYSDVEIYNNSFTASEYGIYIDYCDSLNINNNTADDCDYGIYIYDESSDITVRDNEITNSSESGIYFDSDCYDSYIIFNNLTGCEVGVTVDYCPSITVSNNTIVDAYDGIYYTNYCEDGFIDRNNLTGCTTGITIESCYDTIVHNNTITDGQTGIEVIDGDSDGDYNILEDNHITNASVSGISLVNTYYNTLTANNLTYCSVYLGGDEDTFITQTITTDNTVNGRPVLYYYDDSGITVTEEDNAGQVILGYIDTAIIENLNLSDQNIGLLAGYCYDVDISGSVFDSNTYSGVDLYETESAYLHDNDFNNSLMGVFLEDSVDNEISFNSFNLCENGIYQTDDGSDNLFEYNDFSICSDAIFLIDTWGSTISDNVITTSEDGIHIYDSNQMVVTNNIIGNCSEAGIHLLSCSDDDDTYEQNYIENCTDGILLYQTEDMFINNNYINGSDNAGINSTESSYTDFYENEISNCTEGIQLGDCYEDYAEYNTINLCYNGINVTGTSRGSNIYADVEYNTISSSENIGIKIVGSTEAWIEYNLIQDSGSYGILTNTSEDCTVTLNRLIDNNHADDNYDADHIQASDDCYVYTDTVAPRFYRWWPANGYTITDDYIEPYWRLYEAESGPASSSIRIDGGEWEEAYSDFALGGSNFYDYYYDFYDLSEGTHTIDIIGSDSEGNNATLSFNITVEFEYNGPLFYNWDPNSGITTSDYTELYWEIYSGGTDLASSEIRIDGGAWHEVYLYDYYGPYYYYYYYFEDLSEGTHIIDIIATDEADHYSMISINITVDSDFGGPSFMNAGPFISEGGSPETGSNSWSYDGSGNYWSDWLTPDVNNDSYVDDAYQLAGGNATDPYPLAWMIGPSLDLSAIPHTNSVELSWDGYAYSVFGSIDGYRLMRNSTDDPTNVTYSLESGDTYYNDSSTQPYCHYNYTLRANVSDILGCPSYLYVVTPDVTPPIIMITSPENNSNTTIDSVEVTWNGSDSTGIANYSVALNGGDWTNVDLDTNYTFTGLEANATNELHVMAHANDWDTNETYVSVYYNHTTIVVSPNAPSGFTATAVSSTQINLAWTIGIHADFTRIQRKTGSYPVSISDGTNVYNSTGTSHSDSSLSASTPYYYRAWGWNNTTKLWSADNASAHDTTQSGSVTAPLNFTATAASTSQINLAWTKGTNATDTRIQRKTGSYPVNISDGTNVYNSTGSSKSDTSLSASTTYYYRAWGWNNTTKLWSADNASAHDTTESSDGGGTPPSNAAPVAHADGPYSGYVNQSISFSGSTSTDSDGTIAGYRWDFTNDDHYDTNWSTTPTTTHVYTSAGTYTIKLQVKDNEGALDTDTATVNITTQTVQHQAPVADADGPYSGLTYQNIHFDGTGSHGPDGSIVNYTWNFGDSTHGYGVSPLHSYDSAGTFTVTLTVKDTNNLQNSVTSTATILSDANRNNVSDTMEQTIGANITQDDIYPVEINNTTYDFVDTNGDGILDTFYNPTTNTKTTLGQQDGKILVDVNGDGIWDYVYDPALGTTTPYTKATPPTGGFPWMIVAIIAVVLIVIGLIVWLYKTGRL
jgi:parallel beta-helix repeat protein